MKFRDVAIGALVTLIVSIIGGVIVWALTKADPIAEKLQYNIENAATFTADRTKISFITVKLSNTGTKAARDVKLAINFSSDVEIREKQISVSSGPAANYSASGVENKTVEVTLPSLAINESLTVSLLIAGSGEVRPNVSARSADTLATAQTQPEPNVSPSLKLIFIVYGTGMFAMLSALGGLRFFFRKKRQIFESTYGLNNAAFVLMQLGFIEDAERLLQKSIDTGRANSIILANFAAAKGLSGDDDSAQKLFSAAEWWNPDRDALSVIHYNKAVIAAKNNDIATATDQLTKALLLRKKETKGYCRINVFIKSAAAASPSFKTFIESN